MALQTVFIDGFDHYGAVSDFAAKGWVYNPTFLPAIELTIARTGNAVKLSSSAYIHKGYTGVAYKTLVTGFAYYTSTLSTTGTLLQIMADGSMQGFLQLTNTGHIEVKRNVTSGSVVIGTSSESITAGTWNYIELRWYLHDTTGEWELRINGTNVTSGTGNTKYNGSGTPDYVNQIRLLTPVNYGYFDDLYVRGDTVLTAGGFLGDCKVITSYPDAAGSSTQLTPTGAATNHEATDDATPDGDTSYVESATAGHRDLYGIGNIAQGGGSIYAVQLSAMSKKTDTGYRAQKLVVKSGATVDVGAEQALSTYYTYKTRLLETDPNTGLAFTEANLDAVEAGIEVV